MVFKPKEFDVVYERIINLSPPKNENDKSDRKQLTECVNNNIPFFVTTDTNLKKECKIIEEYFNVTILLPSEFIIKFDQLQNSDSFLPRRIGGATFEIRKIESSNLNEVINSFFDQRRERKNEFRRKFQLFCSEPLTESKVVMQGNKQIAMFAYRIENDKCSVSFIRVKNISFKHILFNQLVTEIIRTSIRLKIEHIEIDAEELEDEMKNLLVDFKFFPENGQYKKIALNGAYHSKELVNTPEIKKIISQEYDYRFIENEQKYELERVIYPGKIIDLEIQNLVIPIKPYWASQLFDSYLSSYSLFGANEKLLWNRKNVGCGSILM